MSKRKGFMAIGIQDPTTFNYYVSKLINCDIEESHKKNGYFLVADTWGTCFFKKTNSKRIKVFSMKNKVHRTYTDIPLEKINDVYFCYLNWKEDEGSEPIIMIPRGGRFIGLHSPIKSKCGEWVNQSALIYSPNGKPLIYQGEISNFPPINRIK